MGRPPLTGKTIVSLVKTSDWELVLPRPKESAIVTGDEAIKEYADRLMGILREKKAGDLPVPAWKEHPADENMRYNTCLHDSQPQKLLVYRRVMHIY